MIHSKPSNHFDLMRLALASIVIIGHGLMIKYPDFTADPVYLIGRVIDMHSLAVDFFFIISGYLILSSWMASPNPKKFFDKRVSRIYPGFIACFLFCLLIVAPAMNPESMAGTPILSNLRHLLVLSAPISDAFAGTAHPALNAPMWTIQFEFACYAMVCALGLARLTNRWLIGGLLIVFIGLSFLHPAMWYAKEGVRLIPFFLAGMGVFLWKPKLNSIVGAGLIATTVLSLHTDWGIRAILPVAGALSVYFLAFLPSRTLAALQPRRDISYGVYLYGWPMQKIVQINFPELNAGASILLSFAFVIPLAILSWKLIEAPFMKRTKLTPLTATIPA